MDLEFSVYAKNLTSYSRKGKGRIRFKKDSADHELTDKKSEDRSKLFLTPGDKLCYTKAANKIISEEEKIICLGLTPYRAYL